MGTVVCEQESSAPVDVLYNLAKNVEAFPEIMPDVESIEVLERTGNQTVTRWVGLVRQLGRKIRWTERDDWDDAARVCTFEQTEGDYEVYRGVWSFHEREGGGTRIRLELEVEIDVPLVGALLRGLVLKLTRLNAEGMLRALAAKAEAAG